MLATAQLRSSAALSVGDRVLVRRVLTHHDWMYRIDGRNIGMTYLPRIEIPETIGVSEIDKARTRSAYRVEDNELVKVLIAEVRVKGSDLWYDANSGAQVHSGATLIARIEG